jgi:hypothetical protein
MPVSLQEPLSSDPQREISESSAHPFAVLEPGGKFTPPVGQTACRSKWAEPLAFCNLPDRTNTQILSPLSR